MKPREAQIKKPLHERAEQGNEAPGHLPDDIIRRYLDALQQPFSLPELPTLPTIPPQESKEQQPNKIAPTQKEMAKRGSAPLPTLPTIPPQESKEQQPNKIAPTQKEMAKRGSAPLPTIPTPADDTPTVLVFAPHPDDECVIGALPLRFRREAGARVINVAVTLGSNPDRRDARRRELTAACKVLGFGLHELGFNGVTLQTRESQPDQWQQWCGQVRALITDTKPTAIFTPHAHDHHPAHIGTHHLVLDSLSTMESIRPRIFLTEFWQAMGDPNLIVESSPDDLALILAALAEHKGEIERNPYHLRLPAWMIDNTRRGTELVGGFGTGGPQAAFPFSTLYRLHEGTPSPALPSSQNAASLLAAS